MTGQQRAENNAALYSIYRFTDAFTESNTHRAGSSLMRLWLMSRTSSFFASHSQSGKDSIWFLVGGYDDDKLHAASKVRQLT